MLLVCERLQEAFVASAEWVAVNTYITYLPIYLHRPTAAERVARLLSGDREDAWVQGVLQDDLTLSNPEPHARTSKDACCAAS